MCYYINVIVLESVVVISSFFGHVDYVWKSGESHGGIWMYSQDGGHSRTYNEEASTSFKHNFDEIRAVRAMLILTLIMSIPIFVCSIVAFCIDRCTPAPFCVATIFGAVQFIFILVAAACMTHGFITSNGSTDADWCFYLVWVSAACCLTLFCVLCTPCADCWKKCDKKHLQRGTCLETKKSKGKSKA